MNIENNFPNLISLKLQQVKPSCSFCGASKTTTQHTEDCFIRSTNVIKQIEDKKRITKLYDEIYTEVINLIEKTNPNIKDLKLTKPILEQEEYTDTDQGGSYSFIDNKIGISKDILTKSEYLIGSLDSSGNIEKYYGLTSSKEKNNKLLEIQQKDKNAGAIKLSKEEQDIYVKAALAHEIRHYIQEHLVASTKNCGEKQRTEIDKLLQPINDEIKKIQEEYIQLCKEEGIEPDKNFIKKETKYYEQYQPRKILPENSVLKFSMFSDDKRYLSTKDHLLKSLEMTYQGKGTKDFDDDYYSNTLEIDAYNFQKEYLYINAKDTKNIRKNIILSFTLQPEEYSKKGLEILNKKGIQLYTK